MKNIVRIVILCLLLVILMVLTVVVYKSVFEKKEVDTLIINDNNVDEVVEEEDIKEKTITEDNSEEESITDKVTSVENSTNSYTENNNSYEEEIVDDNRDPVTYFESKENEISSGGTLEDFKGKFKNYFIEIVDFIFYGKEINGYTFDSLSNSAKLKVISIALKIDSMIDNKVPGYKDTIWSSGTKIYSNAKEKLVTLYLDTSVKVCSTRGEECDKAKEIFSEVKDKCKIGWSFIKNLASNSKDKIKDWYEIYRGK